MDDETHTRRIRRRSLAIGVGAVVLAALVVVAFVLFLMAMRASGN